MRFAKESPSPHPLFFVVNPGWNTVLYFEAGIPFPVSLISMQVKLSSVYTEALIKPFPSSEQWRVQVYNKFISNIAWEVKGNLARSSL